MKSIGLTIVMLAFLTQLPDHLIAEEFPGTQSLTMEGDLAAQMVQGIDRYLLRATEASVADRAQYWKRDFSSRAAYLRSIEPNRERFKKLIGLVDSRDPVRLEFVIPVASGVRTRSSATETAQTAQVGRGKGYAVFAVRWTVFREVWAEGLLLLPEREPVADVVAVPDCDWTPEMVVGLEDGVQDSAQFARRLAENGCRVLVPFLLDRGNQFTGWPGVRHINQPQREYIWRAAFEMGRTPIGYEVQKVLAGVDWLMADGTDRPLGVMGYGEGGLMAFYVAAVDPRIDAVAVSGYFQPREALWQEPIYRNVWGLLKLFGDAEIAGLIAPRPLIVESGQYPQVVHPDPQVTDAQGTAPGELKRPEATAVLREIERARRWVKELTPEASITFVQAEEDEVGTDETLTAFLDGLGRTGRFVKSAQPPEASPNQVNKDERQFRQYKQLLDDTQYLMRESEFVREDFWKKADKSSVDVFVKTSRWYRDFFWDEIIGRLPELTMPPNPRTRKVYETEAFTGYEVVLDVYPDVFAYGVLLMPKDIQPGERRPVVVCQHGLEGRPSDVADPDFDSPYYHQYACRLAERGFITYAPQNPYIGGNVFRQVLRKAQPLQHSLYGFIVRQHETTLKWLTSLPQVDPERLAFYGLSYGGKTAMRIPSLLPQYCLSICSADYNEWIWKNVSGRHSYCYLYWGEYDMPEFDLGNTFNYAELSWLISPRPFMVERGHDDGVAPDDWVAYEYANTRRHYVKLGIGDRTEIEFFDGPHSIHGVGTFEFLHKHLRWPVPQP